jgi:hypothetical protein
MKFGTSYFRKYHRSIFLATLTIVTVIAAATTSLTINSMSSMTMIKEVLAAQPSNDNSNKTSTATSENMSATPVLGNPIFVEHDKITSQKQVDINGIKGLSVTFSGNGTVKGISFTDVGSVLITFRPNGFGDLKGQAVITTTGGSSSSNSSSNDTSGQEKATYTFYATGHQDATGIVKSTGATFLHTNSTTGKLASSIDNLVVVFRNQVDKVGNDITIGWELK